MQKNKEIIIGMVLCLFCIYAVNYFINNSNKIEVVKNSNEQTKYSNALSLMYESEAGSGEYVLSSDSTWPTEDYIYNATLSKCEKGSKISYDETTKKVLVEANVSDKCYVYFDKYDARPTIKTMNFDHDCEGIYIYSVTLNEEAEIAKYYVRVNKKSIPNLITEFTEVKLEEWFKINIESSSNPNAIMEVYVETKDGIKSHIYSVDVPGIINACGGGTIID